MRNALIFILPFWTAVSAQASTLYCRSETSSRQIVVQQAGGVRIVYRIVASDVPSEAESVAYLKAEAIVRPTMYGRKIYRYDGEFSEGGLQGEEISVYLYEHERALMEKDAEGQVTEWGCEWIPDFGW